MQNSKLKERNKVKCVVENVEHKIQKLHGFICTYHLAAEGSNPKHTIYAFQFKLLKLKSEKARK